MDQTLSPGDRVLISDDGGYRFVTVEEAERRLASMPNRMCPRCEGARRVNRLGRMERCAQCQGVGRIPWNSGRV